MADFLQTAETPAARKRCSIALAVYNGERFLGEMLESLFRQTVLPDEIVVCDDDSSDRTFEIVSRFMATYRGCIRYEKNPERLGVAKNFEKAIRLTTGDIIFLADQDDLWLPDKIEKLRDAIAAQPEPTGVFCNSLLTNEKLQPLNYTHWQLRNFNPERPFTGMEQFRRCCTVAPMAGHNIAFDARFKDVLLPFPNLVACHDNWIGIILAAFDAWRIVPEVLTLYRQHESNYTGMFKWRNQYRTAVRSLANNNDEWNYRLYQAFLDRIKECSRSCGNDKIDFAVGRRNYSLSRKNLSRYFLKRLMPIGRLYLNGSYRRYGRGWKNMAQDLILRSFVFPRETHNG